MKQLRGQNASLAIETTTDCSADWQGDFRVLCERSLAGVYVVQAGRISYVNLAMGELLGREPNSIVGQSPLNFVHPDDRPDATEQMRRRLSGKAETSRFTTRLVHEDGNVVYVDVLGSRLNCADGPALMGAMIDVTQRELAARALEERMKFEQLLADLSASFINLPCDQIDPQIEASLKALVEFLGNDRSSFVEFGEDEQHVLVTHSFAVPNCEPFPLGPFAVARLPWFINEFRSGKCVFVRDTTSDLPPEATQERQHCLTNGIKSNVTVPLKAGGIVLGGLTFAFLRNRCQWPSEIISRLHLIGEVFASALLRRRTEHALHDAAAENDRLRRQLEQDNLYLACWRMQSAWPTRIRPSC